VQSPGQAPGAYPSGVPVAKMMTVWQKAAPTICLTAPDIYLDNFAEVCAEYATPTNPLLIPEARRDETAAANVFYAIGKHQALCFSPFGIESMAGNAQTCIAGNAVADASHDIKCLDCGAILAEAYARLQGMMPLIPGATGTNRMTGVLQKA